MTTKIKTTVTFTFSFTSTDEETAVLNLLNWMAESQDDTPTVRRDCESGEYTITDDCRVSKSFKFNNVAELAQKYGTYISAYRLARAVIDYANRESVTAKSETIEVEDK